MKSSNLKNIMSACKGLYTLVSGDDAWGKNISVSSKKSNSNRKQKNSKNGKENKKD